MKQFSTKKKEHRRVLQNTNTMRARVCIYTRMYKHTHTHTKYIWKSTPKYANFGRKNDSVYHRISTHRVS